MYGWGPGYGWALCMYKGTWTERASSTTRSDGALRASKRAGSSTSRWPSTCWRERPSRARTCNPTSCSQLPCQASMTCHRVGVRVRHLQVLLTCQSEPPGAHTPQYWANEAVACNRCTASKVCRSWHHSIISITALQARFAVLVK